MQEKEPAPLVLFTEFGDWALKFQLICFVDEIEMAERVKSEMHFDLHRRLKEAGVKIAFPYPLQDPDFNKPEAAPPSASGG